MIRRLWETVGKIHAIALINYIKDFGRPKASIAYLNEIVKTRDDRCVVKA